MNGANRIVYNTSVLYVRMFLTVGISLYTTRLVLNTLGNTDYGIFSLIAGVIAMLSFLNAAMTTSTQRYLSFYQGKADSEMQKSVFSNSLILHIGIGVIMVFVLESLGFFLFDSFLNIPTERVLSAKTVYHIMSLVVFITVVSVPFTASLNAHENMLWIAVVNIVEVLLKLIIAIGLHYASTDRLVLYGILIGSVSFITLLLYAGYALYKYDECSLSVKGRTNKSIMKELTSFAGWNLFGALCGVGRTQGLGIILNLFAGALINAAYGIAIQISGQMNFFSAALLRAINPQIMKGEGAGDRKKMLRLAMTASKFGFFLLAFVAIPCIFEMPSILRFWLKNVPEHAVFLCDMVLIGILTNQLTIGLQSAAQAVGNIRMYQTVVGAIILFNLPLTYFLLRIGLHIYYVLPSYIFIELIACTLRLFFLRSLAGLSIREYFQKVIFREVLPVFSIVLSSYVLSSMFDFKYDFLVTIGISMVVFVIMIYFFGLCDDEKVYVNRILHKIEARYESSRRRIGTF